VPNDIIQQMTQSFKYYFLFYDKIRTFFKKSRKSKGDLKRK